MIFVDNSLFENVIDYFFVTKFQNRGNQHDHFLIWVKSAPIYGKETTRNIEAFTTILHVPHKI